MFWNLLFAHFIADYPLQPNWMARRKNEPRILLLHVATHFLTMLVVFGFTSRELWPYFLALAGMHLVIDTLKNTVNKWKPQWVIGPYVVDQMFHYTTIWITAAWIQQSMGEIFLPIPAVVAIFLSAYLVITYVWFISERIASYREPDYQKEVNQQLWPRMLVRAALMSVWIMLWRALLGDDLTVRALLFTLASIPALAFTVRLPYATEEHSLRILLTDLGVSIAGFLFILMAVQVV